jgi:hypothetical protein
MSPGNPFSIMVNSRGELCLLGYAYREMRPESEKNNNNK